MKRAMNDSQSPSQCAPPTEYACCVRADVYADLAAMNNGVRTVKYAAYPNVLERRWRK
jgi:hypothetical protein